jgi:hypothetical protein
MVFPVVGGTQDTAAYEISNSLRFEGAAATGLARFGNNSRDGNTFTISAWIKRAKLGRTELFNSKVEDSGVNSLVIMFDSNDKLSVIGQPASGTGAGGNRTAALTSAVYRDLSAWYHVVYRQDTTDGTAGNRHRIYVNGVEQTLGTNDALDQNVAFAYFYNASSYPFAIANDERDNSYGSFYIAEHHYTDGVSNGPDAFGKTNANGVWVPKEYTGSHGSYGHYLKFEQSGGGSGTTAIGGHDYTTGSSSTIGADSSGNDNHFHVQGYGTEDNTTDTPTNNFCTWNPLYKNSANPAYTPSSISEGNLKLTLQNDSAMLGTMGVSKGKWYWEYKLAENTADNQDYPVFGFATNSHTSSAGNMVGRGTSATLGGTPRGQLGSSRVNDAFDDPSLSANDIIGFYLDLDNETLILHKNGSDFMGSGATNGLDFSSASYSNTPDGFFYPFVQNNGQEIIGDQANFGNPTFSISSSNADANGYGSFEYNPTLSGTNYYALCTKNLAEFG